MKSFLVGVLSALCACVAAASATASEVIDIYPPNTPHAVAAAKARPVKVNGTKAIQSRYVKDYENQVVVEIVIGQDGSKEVNLGIRGVWHLLDVPDDGVASFHDKATTKTYRVHTRVWETFMDPPKVVDDEADPRSNKYDRA